MGRRGGGRGLNFILGTLFCKIVNFENGNATSVHDNYYVILDFKFHCYKKRFFIDKQTYNWNWDSHSSLIVIGSKPGMKVELLWDREYPACCHHSIL